MDEEIDRTLPLSAYSYEFKAVVSKLDPKRVLTTDGPIKILRDWRGLAFLLSIPNEISHSISEASDKTIRVLDIWIQRNDGTATLGRLMEYLVQMDRYDIYDDLVELSKGGRILAPQRQITNGNELHLNGHRDDNMIITHDDRRDGYPNYYHAYVLFAKEDWSFVRELLARMKALKFKLCTEYDIEVGYGTQYAPVAQLISERCHRIILVYSPAFIDSLANGFYSDYAQAVSIETNKRNIIPIIYRDCRLPHNLMYYHKLVYNENDEWMPYNFWEKLAQTLDKVKLPNSHEVPSCLTDTELSSSNLKSHFLTTDTKYTSSSSISNSETQQVRLTELDANSSLSNISDTKLVKKKKKLKVINKMLSYVFGKANN
ncbi:unnamed protein product [Diatraea saccharalis]|uniref:Myeloid differentiation primary response protein MyD88 n=1 Tax=Diatraea saccharalis TaxID=40085 RepID=A0A9N9W6Z8_9NEOP|nr:unnamed protein product [Diatraea saccharalis]